jgi:hypothetical protein
MSLELPRIDAYLTTEPPEQGYPPEDTYFVVSTPNQWMPGFPVETQEEADEWIAKGYEVKIVTDAM